MKNRYSRRDFLRTGVLGAGLISFQPLNALSVTDRWQLKRGKSQKVLILGAGMAGLSAGIELRQLGHQVKIIEGQTRAGGRVRTLRQPLANGLYADLGAARIPDDHEWTMKYIRKYNLQLTPFNPSQNDYLHVINGKKIRYHSGQLPDLNTYPVQLTSEEIEMGWPGISTKPFEKLMNNIGKPRSLDWPPKELTQYDSLSFKEYLEQQGFSPAIGDLLEIGWEEKKGLDISVLEMIRELTLSFGADRNKIVGGNDLLPTNMAKDLNDIIQYGTKVLAIEQDESEVRVTVNRIGERSTLTADRVICTFPLTILRKMDFVSTLSAPKQRAIKELNYWDLSRTVMQVSDRYWKKEGLNGFAATDQPSEIWDPNFESEAKRGLIAAYHKNSDSKLLHKMYDQERYDFSARHVNTVFPGLNDHLEGGFTKCWGDDPWALGAHVLCTRNQVTELQPYISSPEGRVHFAGEHTSAYHGWIQGAIESGNRAAKEINSIE